MDRTREEMPNLNTLELQYKEMLQRLRKTKELTLAERSFGEPSLSFKQLEDLSHFDPAWTDIRLDSSMLRDSLRLTEVSAYWESKSSPDQLHGEFHILSPVEILGMGPSPAAEAMEDPFHQEFVAQLRPFDIGQRVVPLFRSNIRMTQQSPLEIWFEDQKTIGDPPFPYGYIKLDLTFVEYQEALLLTKGLHGWQYLFTEAPLGTTDFNVVRERLEHGLQVLPGLFPEDDFSPLQERLEARLSPATPTSPNPSAQE
jgi:hypothetical protein